MIQEKLKSEYYKNKSIQAITIFQAAKNIHSTVFHLVQTKQTKTLSISFLLEVQK